MTSKIVSEMTYNVSSGTLTLLYYTITKYCASVWSRSAQLTQVWSMCFH